MTIKYEPRSSCGLDLLLDGLNTSFGINRFRKVLRIQTNELVAKHIKNNQLENYIDSLDKRFYSCTNKRGRCFQMGKIDDMDEKTPNQ